MVVARPALPALVLAALLGLWLVWLPPSPDLPAQVYRVHLFAADGFSLWDNNWYGGHYLLGYSLLFPALGSLLGLHVVGALAVAASVATFARLSRMRFGERATAASTVFALGAAGDLFIGRIAFAVGVSFALGAVLAVALGRRWLAALLSLACAAASPVAALFLVLAGAADLVSNRATVRAVALAGPALALVAALALLFPEGGEETFGLLSLLAAGGLSALVMLVLPPRERLLRGGLALYLLALALAYLVPSPMGSNAVRLGVLFCPAILIGSVGALDVANALARLTRPPPRRGLWLGGAPTPHLAAPSSPHSEPSSREEPRLRLARPILGALGAGLVLWQLNGPLVQSLQASADPSTRLSYYLPAIRYLDAHAGGGPLRIEVPFTQSHWDAAILGTRFELARGWERQLDIRYNALFYRPTLNAGAYRAWLLETGTRFVALSDAPPDFSSRQEATLIRAGLPYLREVFASAHWRIYAVRGALPLAQGPGRLAAIDPSGFRLIANSPGAFLVRIHYTPYWSIVAGAGSVGEAAGGWTSVRSLRPGPIAVAARLRLSI